MFLKFLRIALLLKFILLIFQLFSNLYSAKKFLQFSNNMNHLKYICISRNIFVCVCACACVCMRMCMHACMCTHACHNMHACIILSPCIDAPQPRKPVVATMAPVVDLKQRNEDQPLHFNQNTGRVSTNSTVSWLNTDTVQFIRVQTNKIII